MYVVSFTSRPDKGKRNPQGWATQRRFSELKRGHPPVETTAMQEPHKNTCYGEEWANRQED